MDKEEIKNEEIEFREDMIDQFGLFMEAFINITLNYADCLIDSFLSKKEKSPILNKLRIEVNRGYSSLFNSFKIYLYILFNQKNIYITDIYDCLARIDNVMTDTDMYLEKIFETYIVAVQMNLDRKFYIPKTKPKFITGEIKKEYISYVNGYNLDNIKEFLVYKKVYGEDIDEILKDIKIFKANDNDTEFYGIYENGTVVIPEITDDKSMLIIINILVKYAMLLNKDEIDDEEIISSETLPNLCEHLYTSYNTFMKEKIELTNISKKLYDEYDDESIIEQANKIKKYNK